MPLVRAIGLTSIGDSGAPRSEAPGVGTNIGIWAIIQSSSFSIHRRMGNWLMTEINSVHPLKRSLWMDSLDRIYP